MITIDGSRGEGGGQMLRTALALAIITGKPFTIERARANRKKPGLRPQHRCAVAAAAQICSAAVSGATLGSQQITFVPGPVRAGHYQFDVGTAGSTGLVFQTVLPALLMADGPSQVTISGGTYNEHAPPYDFLERAFLPALKRMGAVAAIALVRPGFYPVGGGRIEAEIRPAQRLVPIEIDRRGSITKLRGRVLLERLPRHIAEREIGVLYGTLGWPASAFTIDEHDDAASPGNAIVLEIASANLTEVFTGFGRRGVRAERVAEEVGREARDYLASDAPVGPHLADQLLLYLALAGGGSFVTNAVTLHARTNSEVIGQFLDVATEFVALDDGRWRVRVEGSAEPRSP